MRGRLSLGYTVINTFMLNPLQLICVARFNMRTDCRTRQIQLDHPDYWKRGFIDIRVLGTGGLEEYPWEGHELEVVTSLTNPAVVSQH